MKKNLSLLVALLMTLAAMARPVSVDEAQRIASSYWQHALHQQVSQISVVQNTDFSTFYIFDFNQGSGFVIVPADNQAYPILGYSTNSTAAEMGPETRFWLNQYEQEISAVMAGEVVVDDELASYIKSQWDMLAGNTWLEPKSATAVNQLMTTTWNQSPYYNMYCPQNTPAGCLAIAVAQVMRYWGHPIVGQGSHSYNCSPYGTLSADFGSTTYDWAHMPNSLRSTSSATQKQAVGTLCYHVGVAMNMSYAPEGSGAYVSGGYNTAETALRGYFGYKSSLNCKYKSGYSEGTWVNLLKDEISEGRPVIYAGYDAGGGHAFVFDGYNTSNLFHVNWGWGGYYDGYYAMGALNPGGGGTGSNATNTFNSGNHALFGVEPIPTLRANPTNLILSADAESTTFNVISDGQSSALWQATSSASWLTVTPTSGAGMGTTTTITASATANTTGQERHAVVTIVEGTDTARVNISQLACQRADMCGVTIKMASSSESGWCDATMTVSSPSGAVYGQATLNSGYYDEQVIDVCSADSVMFTWNSGSSDNACSFSIVNANNVVLVNHLRTDIIHDGDQWVVNNPCAATGELEPLVFSINTNTNDTLKGDVDGGGEFELGENIVLMANAQPGYRFVKWNDNSTVNPRPLVVTATRTLTATFAALGTDTLQFENGLAAGKRGGGNNFWYGVKLEPADLVCHKMVNGVKFYATGTGTYNVKLYQGGESAPDSMVFQTTRNVTGANTDSWITLSFHTGTTIDHSKPLWVVVRCVGGSDSMAYSYYGGNENGSWYSNDDGATWQQLTQLNEPFYATWMVRPAVDYITDLFILSSSANRPTWGSVTGNGRYHYGETAVLVATPADGYYLERWTDRSTENPHPVVVVSDTTIRAVFAELPNEGIDAPEAGFSTVVMGRNVTVQGADNKAVCVFDAMGRMVFTTSCYQGQPISLPVTGVYMVRVADLAPRKIVAY